MDSVAIVMEGPSQLAVRRLRLARPDGAILADRLQGSDVLIETQWSGISTGTEKLLWAGTMPAFPGMGYPLVPGYETIGRVVGTGPEAADMLGLDVFVPGANCYAGARGLFGGAARRMVVPAARVLPVGDLGRDGVLLALAATAHRAVAGGHLPDLIVGHGCLGRLAARLTVALGGSPTVWEIDPSRSGGATGYRVLHPDADSARDYRTIVDMSGDSDAIDSLIGRLGRGGELVLAGFYRERLDFAFAAAFRKEARLRISAEFAPEDMAAAAGMAKSGALRLDGLISHVRAAGEAADAYPQAFTDRKCVKMVLDWRDC